MGELKRITVKGFKSIKSLVDFELGHLNVIVGANGAGKSNFVQIFEMLRAMCMKGFQSFVFEHGEAKSFPYNGYKVTPKIEMRLEFASCGNKNKNNFYDFTIKPLPTGKLILEETRGLQVHQQKSYGLPDLESHLADVKDDLGQFSSACEQDAGFFIYDILSRMMVYHFHDSSLLSPMRMPELIDDNKYLRPNASNIAPFLLKLKTDYPDYYKSIVYAIRAVMPFFDDFTLETTKNGLEENVKLTWLQKGTDFPMQSFHLSDGSIRFICLATALLQPAPPSIIIIDEPELGLHPAAIEILAHLIEVASRNTQVIVATQSPLLLDQFAVDDIIIAKRENGATVFSRLDANKLKIWLDDYSLGDLWARDIIQGGMAC